MSECPYCINSFEMTETCHDEFRMWQGLVGPYYIPTIEDGILTWTNTGGLPNPNPINIIGAQGNGLYIGGIAETTGDLPGTAENGVTWLVGSDEPYNGYVYLNGSWVDIGAVTPGPTGPQGIPGVGVPSGGTTGQVLQKASNSDYQTEWTDPASGGDPPGTMLPLMDGTAAVGTARSYAREDHVHPQDSEIGELKTSIKTYDRPNLLDNWYFVGGGSQQGNGQFPINQRGQTTYSTANTYGIDRWKLTSGSVTLASSGITLNGTLIQIREEALGVDAYASALLSDGTMITPTYNDSTKTFTLTATGQTIVAVKLELGHDQTLAHQENGIYVLNDFPNYSDEIAKCQRFYDKIPDSTMMMAQFIGNNTIRCQIPVANLAKTPTITAAQFYIYTESGSSAALSISSITVASQYPTCLLVNIIPATTYSATLWRQLCVSAYGTWEISAEL